MITTVTMSVIIDDTNDDIDNIDDKGNSDTTAITTNMKKAKYLLL